MIKIVLFKVGQFEWDQHSVRMNRRFVFSVKCTVAKKVNDHSYYSNWNYFFLLLRNDTRWYSSFTFRTILYKFSKDFFTTNLFFLSKTVRTNSWFTFRRFTDYRWWMGLYGTLCSNVTCSNIPNAYDEYIQFTLLKYSNIR